VYSDVNPNPDPDLRSVEDSAWIRRFPTSVGASSNDTSEAVEHATRRAQQRNENDLISRLLLSFIVTDFDFKL